MTPSHYQSGSREASLADPSSSPCALVLMYLHVNAITSFSLLYNHCEPFWVIYQHHTSK